MQQRSDCATDCSNAREFWLLAAAWLVLFGSCVAGVTGAKAAVQGTGAAPAADGLLLSLSARRNVVLAVGEHGAIRRSTDGGVQWDNVASPTTAALTRVELQPGGTAYAVGFDATILRSDDAGAHWRTVFMNDHADNPLFGVAQADSGAALAVGGFGKVYRSADGVAWQPGSIAGAAEDLHLNALLRMTPKRWLIVGESAQILLSDDAGAQWHALAVPGTGSLFGAVAWSADRFAVFGLRGHIYATKDGGAHFQAVDAGTTAELLGGTVLRDGRAVLVGNRGTEVVVDADASHAAAVPSTSRTNYADCVEREDGKLIVAGDTGIVLLDVPAPRGAP